MISERKQFVLKAVTAVVTGLMALTACSQSPDDSTSRSDITYQPASLEDAAAIDDVVQASTRLGTSALQFHDESQNVVLSPASISLAFAMLAEGAEGPAAEELEQFLGAASTERTIAFSALQAVLAEYDGDPAIIHDDELPDRPMVHMANQAVVRDNGDVKDAYLDILAEHYDAGVQPVDFTSNTARRVLDDWIHHHTGGLIEESAVEPREETLMVLQNAILLAAQWETPFQEAQTQPRDFTLLDGQRVQVDTMGQMLTASYTEYQNAQVIRLPYTEGFAMDVVLPAEGESARTLSAQDWEEISTQLKRSSAEIAVDFTLPMMDLQATSETTDLLRFLADDQGLSQTTTGESLDGIMEADLWIEGVDHQAVLKVDEAGTIAAAVTEIEVNAVSAPAFDETVEMHVDRPFVLRIVHTETDWPLFMAAISDPR